MIHKTIILRDSWRNSIAGRVRHIESPYNGISSVRLVSIRVEFSRVMHFIKTAFSHSLRRFIPLKLDSTM